MTPRKGKRKAHETFDESANSSELKKQLKQMKKQLAQRDKQLAELDEKLAELDEKLAELKHENKDLKNENEQKDNKLYSLSFRKLFERKKIRLQNIRSASSHRNPRHVPAEYNFLRFNSYTCKSLLDCLPSEVLHEPSMFEQSLSKCESKCDKASLYGTEADICRLVGNAVSDAIQLVSTSTGGRYELFYEHGFFSYRPDMIVVEDIELRVPIAAVKVKKPHNGGILTELVAGQVFDYLCFMKFLGHKVPFLVLTSIEETYVGWLNDALSNKIAKQGRTRLTQPKRTAAVSSTKEKTPSPPQVLAPRTSLHNRQAMPASFESCERKFMVSKNHSSRELVPVLCSALECGLSERGAWSKFDKQGIVNLSAEGTMYKGPALALTADSYSWGDIVAFSGQPVWWNNVGKAPTHYIIGLVGTGSTSRVFNAITSKGKPMVIKMVCKLTKEEVADGEWEHFEKIAESKCKQEVENAKKIYSSAFPELAKRFRYIKLGGMHCVETPLFTPLTKEERSEKATKSEIKKVLQLFADCDLKYNDDDVQWRHIGLWNGRIVLYDLADLEEIKKARGSREKMVAAHLKILRSRLLTNV